MRYRIERGRQAIRDLDALFEFLFASYVGFGEAPESAFVRAERRLTRVTASMRSLAARPHQGTLRADLMPGLRSVTKDRAILYFTIDEEAYLVRVLAVFFGGQDHQSAMLRRVMQED
jgi:plasmid stabilization system protein ParE